MKQIIIFSFLLSSILGFSQEKLTLTPEGYLPVVTDVPGMTAEQIRTKTKEWVQTYYKNPLEVLKADLPDEIRISGFCNDCWQTKALGMTDYLDHSYSLIVSFKDGRYKFDYTLEEITNDGGKLMYTYRYFFKKDLSVRKSYQVSFDTMNESVNKTYMSLYNYITGKTSEEKNKW
ncbi:DUF4468 domain-containing protein [Flavobacterium sp. 3HN19-14]|uniref:DUF4468 domain-containing protein n=1 Tax=Flavobacterium sp. 3HN19-14 TaxID=3448133 RepID=UPI003EE017B3